jgi:toxin ParE1/3/4
LKKYTLVADPRVEDDLKEARDFLNSRRKGFGAKFLAEYRNALKNLQNNPLFQVRYKEVHCLPMKTFKYMIHFKVDEQNKTVHIYAVLSTHQDPDKHWI